MKLSSHDRRVLLVGAVGLLAILLVRYAAMPWIDHWMLVRDEAVATRQELDELERRVRRVMGQRGRLVPAYGPGANKPLEDLEAASGGLYQAVQNVLGAAGLKEVTFEKQPSKPLRHIRNVHIVPLQVRGKCDQAQLAKCLAGLKTAESLVFVDRLTATNNEKKPGQLEIVMVLTTLARGEGDGS